MDTPELWLPEATFRQLERELKQLDRHLFLVRQIGIFGEEFYEVRYWNGPEIEPGLIIDWREEDGKPKELSYGILEEIRRMQSQGPIDVAEISRRNQALKQKKTEEMQELYEMVVREFERFSTMGNLGGPIHRSPGLAVARRRARRVH